MSPPAHGGEAEGDAPAYDYVLAVGPSRSGSTFLYRALNAHPGFCAPEIKEAYYYRSPRRLMRALGRLRGSPAMLLDVANTAWPDPRLANVAALAADGVRTLLVVLLRRHRDQARSTMAYRKSRVLPALPGWLSGPSGLERAAVRDSLTPAALERIFALGADVLTVEFEVLADRPRAVLDAMARLCRTGPFGRIATAPANPAQRARFAPLAAAAKLAAMALRAAGARRTLQALKDRPRLVSLVFRPAARAQRPSLSEAACARLDRREQACRAVVEAASEPLAEGLWLARSASPSSERAGSRAGPGGAQRGWNVPCSACTTELGVVIVICTTNVVVCCIPFALHDHPHDPGDSVDQGVSKAYLSRRSGIARRTIHY